MTPHKFLYPTARQFAFDEVCSEIVAELEKRHFDVPGIEVEFRCYGSGELLLRKVSRIVGEQFALHFSRAQGLLPEGDYYNTAAVSTVCVPGERINVYDDNSGPTYYTYVGDDWDGDRENFFSAFHSPGVNSKLNGEPRTYLTSRAATKKDPRFATPGACIEATLEWPAT